MNGNTGFDVYDTGFARINKDQVGSASQDPDSMACAHYLGMVHGGTNLADSAHFESIMRNALALLGHGPDWIVIQAMNPNLDKYKVDFMVDTVDYIATGKRRMYLATWRELCSQRNDGSIKPILLGQRVVNPKIRVPAEWLRAHPTEIISRWLSHDGGLVDMIESLYLMFGGPIEPGQRGSLVS